MGEEKFGLGCWALVVNQQDEFLLIKNSKRGYWEAPGGKVELGEMINDALKREILEETGVDIEVLNNLEIFQCFDEPKNTHWVALGYLAQFKSGEIDISNDEKIADAKWFKEKELPENINPNTLNAIKNYLKN